MHYTKKLKSTQKKLTLNAVYVIHFIFTAECNIFVKEEPMKPRKQDKTLYLP